MQQKIEGQRRQGDVLVQRLGTKGARSSELPADGLREIPRENGVVVLARGTSSGNFHGIRAAGVRHYADDAARHAGKDLAGLRLGILVVEEPAPLEHQEHGVIANEPAVYETTTQREWSDANEPRAVVD